MLKLGYYIYKIRICFVVSCDINGKRYQHEKQYFLCNDILCTTTHFICSSIPFLIVIYLQLSLHFHFDSQLFVPWTSARIAIAACTKFPPSRTLTYIRWKARGSVDLCSLVTKPGIRTPCAMRSSRMARWSDITRLHGICDCFCVVNKVFRWKICLLLKHTLILCGFL